MAFGTADCRTFLRAVATGQAAAHIPNSATCYSLTHAGAAAATTLKAA